MGSNLDALLHLKNAEDALQRLFPDIEMGRNRRNRAGENGESATVSEPCRTFPHLTAHDGGAKHPEANLSRQTDGLRTARRKDVIPLDIDLLSYDQQVLKPEDWQKEYVRLAFRHASFT